MNILITGASRGIGAAAYALLKSNGDDVVGHSTKGSDALIAGDLMDSAAPRNIWDTAMDELDGRIDVLVNNAGIYDLADTDIRRPGVGRDLVARVAGAVGSACPTREDLVATGRGSAR